MSHILIKNSQLKGHYIEDGVPQGYGKVPKGEYYTKSMLGEAVYLLRPVEEGSSWHKAWLVSRENLLQRARFTEYGNCQGDTYVYAEHNPSEWKDQ